MIKAKLLLITCTLFLCSLTLAYTQKVLSLNPLFTEQNTVLVPDLEGYWTFPALNWTISLKKAGDNFYHLNFDIDKSTPEFEAVFVKLNDAIFLDLKGILPADLGDSDYRESFLPIHTIYKINIQEDSINIASFNYSWFYNKSIEKESTLQYEWVDKGMLLRITTEEFKSFLVKHMNDTDIFEDPVYIKVDARNLRENTTLAPGSIIGSSPRLFPQNCFPAFPHKDGWLGGDGDVSVRINDSTTLFLFSDSYVGAKNQKSRTESNMKMVSNTVGIFRCISDDKSEMHYYWNGMYTDHPQPLFRSFTDRYRYWVVDAFTAKNDLYVVLGKVGPKLGAAPDDIFNFSGLGFSLAKISNPTELPYNWNIELLPLSEFLSPSFEIRCHVKLKEHIYFVVCRNDTSQFLVRKPVGLIDDIHSPFEYYASDHQWKQGIKENDLFEISEGFRCNSVNYHPDLKLWVMICDVRFMDNKIKMRTAPALTGPWSAEKVIYEIPEVTPGTSQYSPSNFCYLAREHIRFYDPENHVMSLSYDINNTSYSEIRNHPKIYTPRIIRVPLKTAD
jgi:hypothetical protein